MEKTENIQGINLHYKQSGTGNQVIILLHGWGCDINIFAKIHGQLAEKFTVYTLDLPGFGKSEEPHSIWGIEDYTAHLEAFVKAKNIESPILLGHSFGGRMSLLYASRNEVKKMIITGGAGIKPTRSLSYYAKVYGYKTAKNVLPFIVGKNKAKEWMDDYRKQAGSSDYNSASDTMRGILSKVVNEDLQNVMPKIKASTLLIWGENDTATPLKDGQKMEKLIPDAGLVTFKNAGHYAFLDKSGEFGIIVDNFLNG
jgi:pimeloyl-ACP methyl ester carboxylesterase